MGGGLSDCHTPSSALVKRILATKKTGPVCFPPSYGSDAFQVESYITDNAIDDRAAETLRGEDTSVQEAVIAMGPVGSMQNPSSALVRRIIDIKKNGLGSSQGSPNN